MESFFLAGRVFSVGYRMLITGVMVYYLVKRINEGREVMPSRPRYRRE